MEYLITFEDGSDGYLSHHGVLGMKWGVRNAETRARYASEGRAGSGGYSSGGASKGGLSKGQKRALKTAAIGLGTAAAIGGGVYLARSGGLKKLNTARKAAIKAAKAEHNRVVKNVKSGEHERFNDAVSERMWRRRAQRYRSAPELGSDPRYSKLNRVSNAELHARNIVEGWNRENVGRLPKNSTVPPMTRSYINHRVQGKRTVERSRRQMTKKINAANNAYKKGKRRVDILTGAGGIMAVGAGAGTGAAYNKASRNRRS